MASTSQDKFLIKLKSALCDVPDNLRITGPCPATGEDEIYQASLDVIKQRPRNDRLALLEKMISEGRTINLEVVPIKNLETAGEHIKQLVVAKKPERGSSKQVTAWEHPLVESLNLENRFKDISVPVFFTKFKSHDEKALLRERIPHAFIGVTSADFCIADSATLVLKARPGQARSVSLAPSIHIAVIRLEQIIADLNELYTLLKYDPRHQKEGLTRCMTFITGPSKTADIEAIMVHGVHGPREVYIYVITG
jgi:L-lactate dehydrogenase complex protein LldG